MEIPLFEEGESLRFERIVFYPYPDLVRIWARCWITAVQDESPNLEIQVFNPDGSENTSVFLMAQTEQRIETTVHLKDPVAGARYSVRVELTRGISETPELVESQEFELILEFRNPDRNEPGFGMGVQWDKLR